MIKNLETADMTIKLLLAFLVVFFYFTNVISGPLARALMILGLLVIGIFAAKAVQAGVPVIVSNQSGVAEVMDHAIKIDFWDTDSLANAIINVLRHQGLSEDLRINSKRELESHTWKRAAKKINNIYHELHCHT